MKREWLAIGSVLTLVTAALVAQPRVWNARLETVPAAGALQQQILGFGGPGWVGYKVSSPPQNRGCCYNVNNGICSMGCALEGGNFVGALCPTDGSGNPVQQTAYLEGEREAHILYRVDNGEIGKVRVLSPSCQVDLGGLPLHWLTGVRLSDSVAMLKEMFKSHETRDGRPDSYLSAIASHADPAADQFLKEVAETGTKTNDRERAATWLARTRGAEGLAIVTRLFEGDSDEQFRAHLTSALYQAPESAGIRTLMDAALKDKSRKVRERAFFWLGKSSDSRAQKLISEVLAK